MSKKCRAFSESRLGLEPADNRKAFYAGWEAAIKYVHASDMFEKHVHISDKDRHEPEDDLYDVWVETATCQENRQVAKSATTEWANLTPEEFLQAAEIAERGNYFLAITFAQQTLKEKNAESLQKGKKA